MPIKDTSKDWMQFRIEVVPQGDRLLYKPWNDYDFISSMSYAALPMSQIYFTLVASTSILANVGGLWASLNSIAFFALGYFLHMSFRRNQAE